VRDLSLVSNRIGPLCAVGLQFGLQSLKLLANARCTDYREGRFRMLHHNWRRFGVGLVAALACLALWAPSASARQFHGYGTCNALDRNADPDRICFQGDPFGAVFKAKAADVRYKLCVRKPDGDRKCYRKRTDEPRERSGVWLRDDDRGKYRFKWSVKGSGVVDRARVRVKSEGV
jgi:hypothetical protein